jgi:hypothetical protein
LWLPARRAKLLVRETTRDALRWVQFNTLIRGGVKMPERASLWRFTTQRPERGARAAGGGMGTQSGCDGPSSTGDRLRLVPATARRRRFQSLVAKIEGLLAKNAAQQDLASVRDRVVAALAIAGHSENSPHTRYIKPVVEDWWKAKVLTPIQRGETPIDLRDHLALIELFHALRDNLEIDLRETAKKHFTVLPIFHLLAHYPAPFPERERIPRSAHEDPWRTGFARNGRSRAAALAMVAYDNNAQEMQFLQGWLIQDKFLLRSAYGIPYEFLWANPYQPGLSFHYLPNVFHDPASGG